MKFLIYGEIQPDGTIEECSKSSSLFFLLSLLSSLISNLALDRTLKSEFEIVKTSPYTPKQNAYAERVIREFRKTLDNMILFGQGHLYRTMKNA